MKDKSILKRYTDVLSLFRILNKKQITLLDPKSWNDKNDSKYLSLYKNKNSHKSVLALCFTSAPETNHHWDVFAPGASGVCINFRKKRLLDTIDNTTYFTNGEFRHEPVKYKTLDYLSKNSPATRELPFIKRYAFRDEDEYRIIYSGTDIERTFLHLNIELDVIYNIVLSPSIHRGLAATLKKTVRSIDGCERIKVISNSLNDNKQWENCGKNSI